MNKLFCFLGMSAVGKDTIVKELLEIIKQENLPIKQLMSNTTRPIRKGELSGREYNFTTMHDFDTSYKNGEVIEYNTYRIENTGDTWIYYTLKDDLKLLNDYNCIKIVNPIGFSQLNQAIKNQIVTIKIDAPIEVRKERYLKRGSQDNFNDRLQRDINDFRYLNVNYTINNDGSKSVTEVANEVLDIIKKEMEKIYE